MKDMVQTITSILQDKHIILITVTGGVCAGKTTMSTTVRDNLRAEGVNVMVKPENVTMFLTQSGFPRAQIEGNLAQFQTRMLYRDMEALQTALLEAMMVRRTTLQSVRMTIFLLAENNQIRLLASSVN